MATIIAPIAPSPPLYCAKSVRGANGVQIDIFGYPLPNNLSVSNLTAPLTYPNATTLFDVSSLTPNHEVIVVGYKSLNQTTAYTTYTATWYRDRDSQIIFEKSFSISDPPEGYVWDYGAGGCFWIGWLSEDVDVSTYPYYVEIQENGKYHVDIDVSGGDSFYGTINFAVKGIPANTIYMMLQQMVFHGELDYLITLILVIILEQVFVVVL